MSEREKTPDITSELNALADQVQQDREAGVFLGKRVVSDLAKRLRATVHFDAVNGDAHERAVAAKQMIEAADRLDHLEAENSRLLAVVHDCPQCGESCKQCQCWSDQLTAATSRAEQAERERYEHKRSLKHEQAARLRVEDGR